MKSDWLATSEGVALKAGSNQLGGPAQAMGLASGGVLHAAPMQPQAGTNPGDLGGRLLSDQRALFQSQQLIE